MLTRIWYWTCMILINFVHLTKIFAVMGTTKIVDPVTKKEGDGNSVWEYSIGFSMLMSYLCTSIPVIISLF